MLLRGVQPGNNQVQLIFILITRCNIYRESQKLGNLSISLLRIRIQIRIRIRIRILTRPTHASQYLFLLIVICRLIFPKCLSKAHRSSSNFQVFEVSLHKKDSIGSIPSVYMAKFTFFKGFS